MPIVPNRVLFGGGPDYLRPVHNVYKARFAEAFLTRLNSSFLRRSLEAADDIGNKWKPLAELTHALKQLTFLEKENLFTEKQRGKGMAVDLKTSTKGMQLVTQRRATEWRDAYNLARRSGVSHKKAAKQASEAVGLKVSKDNLNAFPSKASRKYGGIRKTPINVRTGRLIKATEPGAVVNGRYYNRADQVVKFDEKGKLYISLKNIPYATEVDRGGTFREYTSEGFDNVNVPARPIIPENAAQWLNACHTYAKPFAQKMYDQIMQTVERKKANRKKRKK